ncbi:SGNH/GDSL hydrolase family protein [Aquibacillus rhizosphaerae]|uniref:SGNH/GDSL hydrolase family protein n=1 Tax=Aquibacillus rhizosphaerae TaxID=3051431 RepID=A0ABT7L7Q4_9BACI|nr:SGNH/GDSL hydrolase family protein [Aquibacillus sp. LR5S19]MDL4841893.1 SGNH/GDSL hydrolase family protein [Aquibacillus sp. LR5S19]
MKFKENEKIVLIGDSITDAGRMSDPEQLGDGYFRLIRDYYLAKYPHMNLNFVNKGIGGNRVIDLLHRWEQDVISLNPDWVSISIGINDVWRQLDSPNIDQIYPEQFIAIYSKLLTNLNESTDSKIILMEPTIIEEDIDSKGNQLLIPYVKGVKQLAIEFDAFLIPTHDAFVQYLQSNSSYNLTTDGVHMNSIGNMLMKNTWIEAME